jgi:uncharacterized secreted protein with C-terminal beta-propeller domain
MKKLLISSIVLLLLCGSIAGCTTPINIPQINPANVAFAADYDSIYDALSGVRNNYYSYYTNVEGVVSDSLSSKTAMPAPTIASSAPPFASGSSDYSGTNVQVAGIDEGDIVKTDGTYIYSLQNGKLSIFKADGANTRLISTTEVVKNNEYTLGSPYANTYENAIEMYLSGSFVVIITQYYHTSYRIEGYIYQDYSNSQICKAYIYDVSNPAAPALKYDLGQDGNVLASRLIDNTLYLLSTYYVYSFEEDKPETFVPAIYANDAKTLIEPSCIAIMPYFNSAAYTIVSAIDVKSGTTIANQTLLGGGSIVYMSQQNLYIASYEYKSVDSTHNYGIYTVVDYLNYTLTNITRLDISKGSVKVAANGSVPGSLGDQFYMDEYKGYLRVVTTDDSSKYSIYTDTIFGTIDYKWDDRTSSNGLYILDMSLTLVGSVDNLAPGERVYSVRFDGNIGYFVTFKRVDPLFAVDLSNPQKPTVLSALKIPGFSEYLHVYSDGLLFGLGYSADENGRTNSMKLSMFNTSNPKDVTEAHTLPISAYYSTALYNHKAILVDSGKNIIGFPAGSEYLVYGYNSQTGFYLRASINMNSSSGYWWDYYYGWSDSRGLYISEFFYIVSANGVAVIDMKTFNLIKTV